MAKILVIDDDQDVLELTEALLTNNSHIVTTLQDSSKSERVIDLLEPDIILTDIFMDKKSGMEIIALVKENYIGIKIIAMSAGGLQGDKTYYLDKALEMGVEVIIQKPLNGFKLLNAVNKCFSSNME